MARLNVVTSRNIFYSDNAAVGIGRPLVSKNNFNADDFGLASRSSTGALTVQTVRFSPTDSTSVNILDLYCLIRFRIRKLPNSSGIYVTFSGTGTGTDAFHADLNTNGTITFYNGSGTGNPIVTTGVLPIGTGASDWTTIALRLVTSGLANQGVAVIRVNGVEIFNNVATPGSLPGTGVGLDAAGNLNQCTLSGGTVSNVGAETDFDQAIFDDAAFPTPTRHTLVPLTGNGNYQNWAGNNPDWRHRNSYFRIGNLVSRVSTTNTSSRQSYTVGALSDYGITGNIISATVFGESQPSTIGSAFFFYRRNGADVDGDAWSYQSTIALHKTMFNASSWSPSDAIEIGFISPAGAGSYTFGCLGLLVEHDTPYVAPGLQDVEIARINYTGTAALQTIALPFEADFIMIWARTGSVRGAWWWRDTLGFQTIDGNIGISDGIVTVDGANLYLLDTNTAYNQNTIVYDVLVVRDRQNRIFGSGGFAQVNQTSPFDTDNGQAVTPLTSPTLVFVGQQPLGGGSVTVPYMFGPGQANNSTITFSNGAPVANIIEQLNASGFIYHRNMLAVNMAQFPFMALKPGAFRSTQLVDIINFTGDGASSKVVPISLGGATPVWVMVFPHNNTGRYLRNNQQSDSKNIGVASSSAVAITAFGVDSITVGTDLNANGVVYTVIAFAEGTDTPDPFNNHSGIYYLDHSIHHDTLWNRGSGPTVTENVKIPNPTGRTYFAGNRGKK